MSSDQTVGATECCSIVPRCVGKAIAVPDDRGRRFVHRQQCKDLPPRLQKRTRDAIRAEVVSLWLTDRHRTARLAATDEVRTGLYFVESVFWDALPELYEDLDDALTTHYPTVESPSNWLRLASWMGGDRTSRSSRDARRLRYSVRRLASRDGLLARRTS